MKVAEFIKPLVFLDKVIVDDVEYRANDIPKSVLNKTVDLARADTKQTSFYFNMIIKVKKEKDPGIPDQMTIFDILEAEQ